MDKPGVAIILYTVREPAKENLDDCLARVRDAGFEYVQWSGMPPMDAEAARAALDKAGLKAIAGHCQIPPFEEDFAGQVKWWKTVGALDVAPGMMMRECMESLDTWLEGCRRLDAVGAKLRAEGMRLSYHNHAVEFETFEGDPRYKLDVLYEETGKENLYAELDLCWVAAGGQSPADYLRKYAGRCPVIHVKDMKGERGENDRPIFTPLGKGVLDWDAIFPAAKEAGVEWYVYEQDSHEGDLWDCVKTSREFLRNFVG